MPIKLISKIDTINENVLTISATRLNKALVASRPNIKRKISQTFFLLSQHDPVLNRLAGGDLAGHFGFKHGTGPQIVSDIISVIGANIKYETRVIRRRGKRLVGGASIYVLSEDFADILSLPAAKVVTEEGTVLPWLDWMLLRGDSILITGYDISFSIGKGRSGQAVMVPGQLWKVPGDVAGTPQDNFLTRLMNKIGSELVNHATRIIEDEVARRV